MAVFTETNIEIESIEIHKENEKFVVTIVGYTIDTTGARLRQYAYEVGKELTVQQLDTLQSFFNDFIMKAKTKLSIV